MDWRCCHDAMPETGWQNLTTYEFDCKSLAGSLSNSVINLIFSVASSITFIICDGCNLNNLERLIQRQQKTK